MYKVPMLGAGANTDSATGYEYVYYDSALDEKNGKVVPSPYTIDSGKGALNQTLDSVFKAPKKTTGYILYNDEAPDAAKIRDDGNLGHTKGVIAFDTASNTAYWLLHSWPKFSDPTAKKDPTPKYGQTYLCLSLDIESARKLAAQMAIHQEPQTFLSRTANLPKDDPLTLLTGKIDAKSPADSDVLDLQTVAGMKFKVIAKNKLWNKDFWNGLVGPTLKEDLDVETWIRGAVPPIADTDGIHKTFDIKYINLGVMGLHWAWPETHDHAKWAITLKGDWVCVGDINRMISQRKRGGGTIAFQNATLWKALSQTGLLLAPPGKSRTEAHAVLKATHEDHHAQMHAALVNRKPAAPRKAAAAPRKKAAATPKKAPATRKKAPATRKAAAPRKKTAAPRKSGK
jgi:deoxyribonuclease-2